jgi:hypothetical protein
MASCYDGTPDGELVIMHYGFKDEHGLALAVLLGEWALFRLFQAFALKTMNLVQR